MAYIKNSLEEMTEVELPEKCPNCNVKVGDEYDIYGHCNSCGWDLLEPILPPELEADYPPGDPLIANLLNIQTFWA